MLVTLCEPFLTLREPMPCPQKRRYQLTLYISIESIGTVDSVDTFGAVLESYFWQNF